MDRGIDGQTSKWIDIQTDKLLYKETLRRPEKSENMTRTFILLVLLCQTIMASGLTVKGKVATASHEALPFASVFITDLQIGATTNLDGQYSISGVPAGEHTMVVSYVGYGTQTLQFKLEKDDVRDFTLEEQVITLNELFVTPTGQSIERFILDQTVSKAKPLSKVVRYFDLTKRTVSEQRGESLKPLFDPYMKPLNIFLGMFGFRNAFHYMLDNPNSKIEFLLQASFSKGKLKVEETGMGDCNPVPDKEQEKSFLKLISRFGQRIGYDETYEILSKLRKEVQKTEKKSPKELSEILRYLGKYEEDGHTIHILGIKKGEIHIVDGCWQVRRFLTKEENRTTSIIEFCEIRKGIFLPISQYRESSFGIESTIKTEIEDLKKKDLSSMKPSEAAKTKEQIEKLEHILQSGDLSVKTSIAYEYRGLK